MSLNIKDRKDMSRCFYIERYFEWSWEARNCLHSSFFRETEHLMASSWQVCCVAERSQQNAAKLLTGYAIPHISPRRGVCSLADNLASVVCFVKVLSVCLYGTILMIQID